MMMMKRFAAPPDAQADRQGQYPPALEADEDRKLPAVPSSHIRGRPRPSTDRSSARPYRSDAGFGNGRAAGDGYPTANAGNESSSSSNNNNNSNSNFYGGFAKTESDAKQPFRAYPDTNGLGDDTGFADDFEADFQHDDFGTKPVGKHSVDDNHNDRKMRHDRWSPPTFRSDLMEEAKGMSNPGMAGTRVGAEYRAKDNVGPRNQSEYTDSGSYNHGVDEPRRTTLGVVEDGSSDRSMGNRQSSFYKAALEAAARQKPAAPPVDTEEDSKLARELADEFNGRAVSNPEVILNDEKLARELSRQLEHEEKSTVQNDELLAMELSNQLKVEGPPTGGDELLAIELSRQQREEEELQANATVIPEQVEILEKIRTNAEQQRLNMALHRSATEQPSLPIGTSGQHHPIGYGGNFDTTNLGTVHHHSNPNTSNVRQGQTSTQTMLSTRNHPIEYNNGLNLQTGGGMMGPPLETQVPPSQMPRTSDFVASQHAALDEWTAPQPSQSSRPSEMLSPPVSTGSFSSGSGPGRSFNRAQSSRLLTRTGVVPRTGQVSSNSSTGSGGYASPATGGSSSPTRLGLPRERNSRRRTSYGDMPAPDQGPMSIPLPVSVPVSAPEPSLEAARNPAEPPQHPLSIPQQPQQQRESTRRSLGWRQESRTSASTSAASAGSGGGGGATLNPSSRSATPNRPVTPSQQAGNEGRRGSGRQFGGMLRWARRNSLSNAAATNNTDANTTNAGTNFAGPGSTHENRALPPNLAGQQPPAVPAGDQYDDALRLGEEETRNAMMQGHSHVVRCQGCNGKLHAPMRYSLVYCPHCKIVSPGQTSGSGSGPTPDLAPNLPPPPQDHPVRRRSNGTRFSV